MFYRNYELHYAMIEYDTHFDEIITPLYDLKVSQR